MNFFLTQEGVLYSNFAYFAPLAFHLIFSPQMDTNKHEYFLMVFFDLMPRCLERSSLIIFE